MLMGEGAWASYRDCKITFPGGETITKNVDVGGSTNTLSPLRPMRICQGSTYGHYIRVKIQKVQSVELA
jgi:hypothetical protein